MKSLRELLLTLNKEGFGKIGSFDSMDVEDQFSVIKKHYHRRCLETHPDKGGNVEGKNCPYRILVSSLHVRILVILIAISSSPSLLIRVPHNTNFFRINS